MWNIWYFAAVFFIIFSFAGWCWESVFVSLTTKKLTNRGFMTGPFCPIYGVGISTIYLALTPLPGNLGLVPIFIFSVFTASLLEYFVSWAMESIFKARWWDYSRYKINLNGRIAAIPSLFWGITAVIAVKAILPPLQALIEKKISIMFANWSIGIFTLYMIADVSVSAYNTFGISRLLSELERIKEEMRENMESITAYTRTKGLRYKLEKALFKISDGANLDVRLSEARVRFERVKTEFNRRRKRFKFVQRRWIDSYPHMRSKSITKIDETKTANK